MSSTQTRGDEPNDELVIDGVLSTQPELGPSIPDGGYGWVIFLATLFFQALIPSMAVSFGVFLAFSRLPNLTSEDVDPKLWDDKMFNAPLFFIFSWTFFDPITRALISSSTWPRLVATGGTCLTCAGLLFLWMGMTGYGDKSLFILAGLVSGIGASIQISQCEILLAQYFRLKHGILAHITQAVTALGFIMTPIVIGHYILNSSLLHVILWYQAVILQGLILNLTFKKPLYLKSKQRNRYNYITANADDEEDIFSKNSRELQIKRQDSNGTTVTIEKHDISTGTSRSSEGPSTSYVGEELRTGERKNWETFGEDKEEPRKTSKENDLKEEWVTFDEDEDEEVNVKKQKDWERFDDDNKPKTLQQELYFADTATSVSNVPTPLFSDLPVNNNNTYSYDALDHRSNSVQPAVFMPTTVEKNSFISNIELLQKPTFYKSLLTVITTKFSFFIYYTLFPSYLYQELEGIKMVRVSSLVGLFSMGSLLFAGVSYWVNIDKKRRPICLWALCWVGSFGYFMVSDSNTEQMLLFGAVQVTLSIASLQYVGLPLLGLTLRGETNKEFTLICMMTGSAFLFFLFINSSFKDCFRLMALLHFFTGAVWFSNYIYKKIVK